MMTRTAEDMALAIADEFTYADVTAAIVDAAESDWEAIIDRIRYELDTQPAPATLRVQAYRASFREMVRA